VPLGFRAHLGDHVPGDHVLELRVALAERVEGGPADPDGGDPADRARGRGAGQIVEDGELADEVTVGPQRQRGLRATGRRHHHPDHARGQHVDVPADVTLDDQRVLVVELQLRARRENGGPLRVGQASEEAGRRPGLPDEGTSGSGNRHGHAKHFARSR
jgi:hypothetical protein